MLIDHTKISAIANNKSRKKKKPSGLPVVSFVYVSFLIMAIVWVISESAAGSVVAAPHTEAVGAEESRVLPVQKEPRASGLMLGVGMGFEKLRDKTAQVWSPNAPQLFLSVSESIGRAWDGRLKLFWSDWSAKENVPDFMQKNSVAPMGIESHLNFKIRDALDARNDFLYWMRPYLCFGFGLFALTLDRVPPPRKAPHTSTESSFSWGGGLGIPLGNLVTFVGQLSYHKGLKSSQYTWQNTELGIVLGENQ